MKECAGEIDLGLVSDLIIILCDVETANTKTLKKETDSQVQARWLNRDPKVNLVITSYKIQVPGVFMRGRTVVCYRRYLL